VTEPARAEAALLAALGLTRRRRTGCYLTPPPLAETMAQRLVPLLTSHPGHRRVVLDPAAGTGRLLAAVASAVPGPAPRLVGVELQPEVAALAQALHPAATVHTGDGLALLAPGPRAALFGGADAQVDAVIANPPYLGEKGNAEVFRALRAAVPEWGPLMAPRQDLQQLFVLLALRLLRPGGELVFLMNGYWLTSDAGAALREALDRDADLLELVDFGATRLFEDAPGQHGLLLHARRRRQGTIPGILPGIGDTEFSQVLAPQTELTELCRQLAHGGPAVARVRGHIATSGARGRWYFPAETRAPSDDNTDARLARLERAGVPLGELFATHQGVVSGADRVTASNVAHLGTAARVGEGVFVLSDDEVEALGLSDEERAHLRRVVRGRQIGPYAVAPAEAWIIYATDELPLERLPGLHRHLARFEPLLRRRRECQTGTMPWYRLHWPRSPRLFDRPRLITPRRAPTPRFALALPGHCEQSDLALITDPRDDETRLAALLVVLNSAVVADWCRHRGKQKGAMREFFGRSLEEIPLPAAARDDPAAFAALAAFADGRHRDRERAESLVRALYDR
jgi:adenine-specific DNA-methyltransferase